MAAAIEARVETMAAVRSPFNEQAFVGPRAVGDFRHHFHWITGAGPQERQRKLGSHFVAEAGAANSEIRVLGRPSGHRVHQTARKAWILARSLAQTKSIRVKSSRAKRSARTL